VLKKSAKDIAGKSALISFNIALFGTPEKVTDALTEEMFESGFLARFLWTQGDPAQEISAEDTESEVAEVVARAEYDSIAARFRLEFMAIRHPDRSRPAPGALRGGRAAPDRSGP
jgi:hypothetical protein